MGAYDLFLLVALVVVVVIVVARGSDGLTPVFEEEGYICC